MRQDKPEAGLQAYELALSMLPEYAYNYSADNAALLQPVLQARRGIALKRLHRLAESDQAFQQADALVQAILEQTPKWPPARLASAGVFYLMGNEILADGELERALACDASLQTAAERLKPVLALLR
jgi:tetratricopeptide (TPR) repeat protein